VKRRINMETGIENETTTTEEEGKSTLPKVDPMDKRKMELREVLKQYCPENNVYFSGSSAIPQTVSKEARAFLENGQGVMVEEGDIFVSQYDDIDILTIDFFYAFAATVGRRFVINAICGPQAAAFMPREGFPSLLADRASTFQLAFYYAARHGYFYENVNHDVYSHAYSSTFGAAFHPNDDVFRIRLNRYSIYEDLVMWDYRAKQDIEEVLTKTANSDDEDVKKQLVYVEKVKANADAYPFQGEARLGTFIPNFGYFPPGKRLPIYRTIVKEPYAQEEDDRSSERVNLDANLMAVLMQYLRFLYTNGIDDPDMTRFKFCSINKDQDTLIVDSSIKRASDEEVKTEYAIFRVSMGLSVPDVLPILAVKAEDPNKGEETSTTEEEENGNADS